MKFSDLDKNLVTEAEGVLSRAGTKLKKKLGPTKKIRQRATGKAEIQQQALDIKSQFHNWAGKNDLDSTVGAFKEFLDGEYPQLASYVDDVAVKLKFKEKEVEKPQAQPADSEKADEVGDEEQEDMVSPEEMTGEKPSGEQSEEEIRAAYAKQGEEAEAEAKELGAEDDEVEEEVDMSASIYESRLAYLLIEETKLKDNQLDTLIVRVLQAAQRTGKKVSTGDSEKEAEPKKKEKKLPGSLRQKVSDVLVGDASRSHRARQERKAGIAADDESTTSSSSPSLSDNEIEQVKNRLDKFGADVKNVIRKQSIDDKIKRKMSDEIDDLVAEILNNSF